MMKRLLLSFVILVAGCTGTSLTDTVKAIQDKTVELCAYLPTATSVAAVITAGDPTTVGISAVANAICTAVVNWQTSKETPNSFAADCPKVNDICISGEFVQPKGN